jgi:hypothetical protein
MRTYTSNITSLTTYKGSETFKKNSNGFDGRAYKGWDECWNKHVIPLVIKNEELQQQLLTLTGELNKLKGKV